MSQGVTNLKSATVIRSDMATDYIMTDPRTGRKRIVMTEYAPNAPIGCGHVAWRDERVDRIVAEIERDYHEDGTIDGTWNDA